MYKTKGEGKEVRGKEGEGRGGEEKKTGKGGRDCHKSVLGAPHLTNPPANNWGNSCLLPKLLSHCESILRGKQ